MTEWLYLTSWSTWHSDKNVSSLSWLRTFLTASVRNKCSEQYFGSEKNCSFEVFAFDRSRYCVASSTLRRQRSFLTCSASSISQPATVQTWNYTRTHTDLQEWLGLFQTTMLDRFNFLFQKFDNVGVFHLHTKQLNWFSRPDEIMHL